MGANNKVRKQGYIGLFMVTLSSLMYEILLTRIFSVTMWYHFAFMAISIAMFGMTVGAILVYLLPGYFTQKRAKYHLALSSLLFSLSVVISFLVHLGFAVGKEINAGTVLSLALMYAVISVPFVFSGICVCLALTKFPRQVSKLYAADLLGAAAGCVLLIYTLKITDGPTAVIVIAFLISIGTIFFTIDGGYKKLRRISFIFCFLFGLFAATNTFLAHQQSSLLRLKWVKGNVESRPIYEKWNSFARIIVFGNPDRLEKPFSWNPVSGYPGDPKVRQLTLNIDANAATALTAFDGNLDGLQYLKYDLANLAHYIRPNSNILVVGAGGGRDILSALVFGQASVIAVEINQDIINAVNRVFGDFTGHLDKNPRVTFINDEARSYVARSKDKFDIIQITFIDTWAATAAGAYVLTENSLYTVEAWKTFLGHLNSKGVLTVSRFYFRGRPGEMYRLTSLASSSLARIGIDKPRDHIVIVKHMWGDLPIGVGTILVSKDPFSAEDLSTIRLIASKMKFDIVLTPQSSFNPIFETIASGKDLDRFTARFPIDISPPTDDNPFFFHMLRFKNIFNRELWNQGLTSFNMKAVFILGSLLIIVTGLTFLCIIVPLVLTTKKEALRGALPSFVFFAAIGFGFMLIEISQMQRLIVFLGHPTYALSTVLFSLLLSSGLGSYSTGKITYPGMRKSIVIRLALLLVILSVFGKLTPHVTRVFEGAMTPLRIAMATALLFPLGLFMGMAFPLGMKVASARRIPLTPWLWGINGATSVCASVLAVAISLILGISMTFWIGLACYVVAFLAFACQSNREDN